MSRKTNPNKKYNRLRKAYMELWTKSALYEDTLKMVLDDPRTKDVAEDIHIKLTKLLPAIDRYKEIQKLGEVLDGEEK